MTVCSTAEERLNKGGDKNGGAHDGANRDIAALERTSNVEG